MPGAGRAACLVAPAGADLDAMRRSTLLTAESLAAAGWRVHVLWCGGVDVPRRARTDAAGAACRVLDDFGFPDALALDGPHVFAALHDSDRVLHALRELHAQHRFDRIDFPDRGGLGFRAIQAKQTGQAFADVALCVNAHGLSRDAQHERQEWLSDPDHVALDYMERYSKEYCDKPEAQARDAAACASAAPLVTCSVAYCNLGEYLEETLSFLARQTYANLEVLVINDGSTEPHSIAVFEQMRAKFPQFRFMEQANAGIGATRNRGLREARGTYFIPVDADNIPRLDMVERFVQGMEHNPDLAALTCYFLAFRQFADLIEQRFAYAYKPTGGPRVLGCLRNIYGDGNAVFRTEALRAVGGFETERDTSFEDWEVFVKLTNEGMRVEVLPDFLFYYRHRDAGFSRTTNGYRNHQRVLRQFLDIDRLPRHERAILWNLLVGSQRRLAELEEMNRTLANTLSARRYRLADGVKNAMLRIAESAKHIVGL